MNTGIFKLTAQFPKPRCLGDCTISLDDGTLAMAMDATGEKVFAPILHRARVQWMQARGFMVTGYEETGVDRTGRPKYRFQEWYCAYKEDV